MTHVWISVKALPNCRSRGIQLHWEVWQVIILAVNETIRLWQRRMSPMMEVWNHPYLKICKVWCKCYSHLSLNIFIDYVDYDCFWCQLWLFLTWIIIFDTNYDYFGRILWWYLSFFLSMWCIFYLLIIQGLISQRENQQSEVNKRLRLLMCTWVVVFPLRKIWVTGIHHMCQETRIRLKGGSVSVMKR